MAETSTKNYHDSLALWSAQTTTGQQAILLALWHCVSAPKQLVRVTQPELARLTGLKVQTVCKYLRRLERLGAISRLRPSPRGQAYGYEVHHHPDAPTNHPDRDDEVGERVKRRRARRAKGPPAPPPGVMPSDIAGLLETLPGVRSNLRYSGPGAWQVNNAIEAMHEAGWGLAELEHAIASYAADPREDKPPPDKLFSGKERTRDAIERYGPQAVALESSPQPASEPAPSDEAWIGYLAHFVPPDDAASLFADHRESITAMGQRGVEALVMNWKRRGAKTPFALLFSGASPRA